MFGLARKINAEFSAFGDVRLSRDQSEESSRDNWNNHARQSEPPHPLSISPFLSDVSHFSHL